MHVSVLLALSASAAHCSRLRRASISLRVKERRLRGCQKQTPTQTADVAKKSRLAPWIDPPRQLRFHAQQECDAWVLHRPVCFPMPLFIVLSDDDGLVQLVGC